MSKIDYIIKSLPNTVYKTDESSNIYKILSSVANELDCFMLDTELVKNSHFVNLANGNDLDSIGKIINTPRIRGENDASYKGRIKSKVPSFVGGGTIDAIIQVIEAFTGVSPIIIEHYKPGEGHSYFDNGILSGFTCSSSSLNLSIKGGTAYIQGTRITLNDSNLVIDSNSTTYIILLLDGTLAKRATNVITSNETLIAKVVSSSKIDSIQDLRFILDTEQHYITNTASITVQIPISFTNSLITLDDVKNVLRRTKAAGIALLVQIAQTLYSDNLSINDKVLLGFNVGFSGVGSSNFIASDYIKIWDDFDDKTWNSISNFTWSQIGASNYYWS